MMKLLISFLFFPVLLFGAESVTGFSNKNTEQPRTVASSLNDKKYEGLYYNGPLLGYGFAPKDQDAQRREQILQDTRESHDRIIEQTDRELLEREKHQEYERQKATYERQKVTYKRELEPLLDRGEQCCKKCPTILRNLYPKQILEGKKVKWEHKKDPAEDELQFGSELENIENSIDEIQWKISNLEQNFKDPVNITLNPVIIKINSGEKQLCSVPLYSLLHNLRQESYEYANKNAKLELKKDGLPAFFLKLMHENPDGIQAEYTDGQKVFIRWDNEENNIMYCSRSS